MREKCADEGTDVFLQQVRRCSAPQLRHSPFCPCDARILPISSIQVLHSSIHTFLSTLRKRGHRLRKNQCSLHLLRSEPRPRCASPSDSLPRGKGSFTGDMSPRDRQKYEHDVFLYFFQAEICFNSSPWSLLCHSRREHVFHNIVELNEPLTNSYFYVINCPLLSHDRMTGAGCRLSSSRWGSRARPPLGSRPPPPGTTAPRGSTRGPGSALKAVLELREATGSETPCPCTATPPGSSRESPSSPGRSSTPTHPPAAVWRGTLNIYSITKCMPKNVIWACIWA